LVLVKLDSLTWQELHDYSNRDKWRLGDQLRLEIHCKTLRQIETHGDSLILEIGVWIMGYGSGIRDWRLMQTPIGLKPSIK